jgi:hypothetical protein
MNSPGYENLCDSMGGAWTWAFAGQNETVNVWAKGRVVTGGRRKLRNEELYDVYSSQSIIRQRNVREWDRQDMQHE